MLFQVFINHTVQRAIKANSSIKVTLSVLCFVFCLSACTSTSAVDSDNSANQAAEVETDSNNISSRVNDEAETLPSSVTPAINLYLVQQANNPVVIPEQVVNDYQQAISLMKNKQWQQAQVLFEQVILNQPQLSGSYVNKAIIVKQQGKLTQAQALLDKAIEVNSLNLYAHHVQGQNYRLQGEFDLAEQSYLAALAIWPDFAEAQVSMAILLELYRGRLLDAYGYYHSYLLLKPNDEDVKRWQAGLSIKIKRAGLTIPFFDKIDKVDTAATDKQLTSSNENQEPSGE